MTIFTRFFSKQHLRQIGSFLWKWWIACFAIIIIAYVATYVVDPDMKSVMNEISKKLPTPTENETYWQSTWKIFKNNWMVCGQVLLVSLIPIPFLYTLSLILTTSIMGIVLFISQKAGMGLVHTIVFGLLPHSILEISVFIVAMYYGHILNRIVRQKVFRFAYKEKPKTLPFWKQVKETVLVLIFIITPSIFLAAFIEGYVTGFLMNL